MLPYHGKYPKLDPKSCVMPGAELAGDVELKEFASIWQNCALRGDVNKIVVGVIPMYKITLYFTSMMMRLVYLATM